MSIREHYESVCARVRKAAALGGRDPASVQLIAVSKTQPVSSIEALYELGHRDFGENYAQELFEKSRYFQGRGITDLRWHFVGHLQTNKVKMIAPDLPVIHSIDSFKLAQTLDRVLEQLLASSPSHRRRELDCFIEVNIDREPSKAGLAPDQVADLALRIAKLSRLRLCGLMCIPAPSSDGSDSGQAFTRLSDLEKSCRPNTHGQLSMGMTQDFEQAIQRGATHVRVGTALFGPRAGGTTA